MAEVDEPGVGGSDQIARAISASAHKHACSLRDYSKTFIPSVTSLNMGRWSRAIANGNAL